MSCGAGRESGVPTAQCVLNAPARDDAAEFSVRRIDAPGNIQPPGRIGIVLGRPADEKPVLLSLGKVFEVIAVGYRCMLNLLLA